MARGGLAGLVCAVFLLQGAPLAAAPGDGVAAAFDAIRDGDWDAAAAEAAEDGPTGRAIVEWTRLRNGQGSFADYLAFTDRYGDWPGLQLLRRRGEPSIPADARAADVLRFFGEERPQTGWGAERLAAAYAAQGQQGDTQVEIVIAWRTLVLSAEERARFLRDYGPLLAEHHTARLDMLLWRGLSGEAEEMFPLVNDGWKALARARVALRGDRPGVDDLIAAVPASLAGDAGLAYERFQWRARRGRIDDAVELLLERSVSGDSLGEAERWADRRRAYARDLMRDGKGARAYAVASRHFLSEGSNFADLEWLAGYLALTYLDEPALALDHFQRFRGAVWTPISVGRAAYWMGRAHEALGDPEAAMIAYRLGAENQQGFYGLLAAEKAGVPMDPRLAVPPRVDDWQGASFARSTVFEAARLFLGAGQRSRAEQFLSHLSETLPEAEFDALAAAVASLGDRHLEVAVGKAAAFRGVSLPQAYFPTADLGLKDLPVPEALALAVARRESEFDPVVVSPAGAMGLMQLMPGTAQLMARETGVGYDRGRLLTDPAYNATLGSGYLARLVEEFGDNYILVAAGYNAGPGRPRQWIERFGDPRDAGVDPVAWIELIPFRETQSYVMRVLESYVAYDARLKGAPQPIRLTELMTAR